MKACYEDFLFFKAFVTQRMPGKDGQNRHMTSSLRVQFDFIWRRNWTPDHFCWNTCEPDFFWKCGRWKLELLLLHEKVRKNAEERRKEKKEEKRKNRTAQPVVFMLATLDKNPPAEPIFSWADQNLSIIGVDVFSVLKPVVSQAAQRCLPMRLPFSLSNAILALDFLQIKRLTPMISNMDSQG